jgi:hypothetical protein
MSSPYEGLQEFVAQVPEFLQPLIVAGLGAIPYVEGEASAALGIIVGINPIVAAIAGATGNILSVLVVVLLSSRVREAVIARQSSTRYRRTDASAVALQEEIDQTTPSRKTKGRQRLSNWLVRFGVPGASILAPLALPTQLTAAFFVSSGVKKSWVMLWQIVAILLWTGMIAAGATGLVAWLGW